RRQQRVVEERAVVDTIGVFVHEQPGFGGSGINHLAHFIGDEEGSAEKILFWILLVRLTPTLSHRGIHGNTADPCGLWIELAKILIRWAFIKGRRFGVIG